MDKEDLTMNRRIEVVGVILFLLALFCLYLQPAAFADMTVTQEVTRTAGDSTTTTIQTTYRTKTKMRTDHLAGFVIITDIETHTVTALNPKQNTYVPNRFGDLQDAEARLYPKAGGIQFSVKETDEKKDIDGYPCEKLVFTVGPGEIVAWVTQKIAIDPSVTEFNNKFLELTRHVKSLNAQAQMEAAFDKLKAYPYLTIVEVSPRLSDKVERIETKVKNVSYERIDPCVFAIPSGYKKLSVPPLVQE